MPSELACISFTTLLATSVFSHCPLFIKWVWTCADSGSNAFQKQELSYKEVIFLVFLLILHCNAGQSNIQIDNYRSVRVNERTLTILAYAHLINEGQCVWTETQYKTNDMKIRNNKNVLFTHLHQCTLLSSDFNSNEFWHTSTLN